MDKLHEESRKQFEKLCNEFCNWQEHDEITKGEEEPCLKWDGENYTHRVTAALWRMFKASRASIVVELPDQMTEVVADTLIHGRVMANDMRTACAKAIRSIGLSIKGE